MLEFPTKKQENAAVLPNLLDSKMWAMPTLQAGYENNKGNAYTFNKIVGWAMPTLQAQ